MGRIHQTSKEAKVLPVSLNDTFGGNNTKSDSRLSIINDKHGDVEAKQAYFFEELASVKETPRDSNRNLERFDEPNKMTPIEVHSARMKFWRQTGVPIILTFGVLTAIFYVYKALGLSTSCEASPKEYSPEYPDSWDRVKDDIDQTATFKGDRAEKCAKLSDWLADTIPTGLVYGLTMVIILLELLSSRKAKNLYYFLGFFGLFAFWGFSFWTFSEKGEKHTPYLDVIFGIWISVSAAFCARKFEFGCTGKPYFIVFFATWICIPYLLNTFTLGTIVQNLSAESVRTFIIFYPIIISLFEAVSTNLSSMVPNIDCMRDEQMEPMCRFIVGFFEGLRYGVALFSFEEEEPTSFILFLLTGSIMEMFSRNRGWTYVAREIKWLKTRKRKPLAPRTRLAQGLYSCKFDMEYIPLLYLIHLRWTNWVFHSQPGNNLDKRGTPDIDLLPPIWVYFLLVLSEVLADVGSYCINRYLQLGNFRRFDVKSFWISCLGVWACATQVMINLVATSSVFYTYRFGTA